MMKDIFSERRVIMDNKTVYAIFSCDDHKMRDSMRLIAIADNDGLSAVYEDIAHKYGYSEEEMETYTTTETLTLNELC